MPASEQQRRASFIQTYLPVAQRWAQRTGLPADFLLAVAAHESNFGNTPGFALFGMTGQGPAGSSTLRSYNGQPVTLRKYTTPDEAFGDFIFTITTARRYAPAYQRFTQDKDIGGFLQGLVAGGYSGGEQAWGGKIQNVMRSTIAPLIQQAGGTTSSISTGTNGTGGTARTNHPVSGPISQGFGPTTTALDGPYAGHQHFNKGNDYAVPVGTPVRATVGGKVIAAGPGTEGWGIRVWVQEADGTIHNYGHLSEVGVKVGDTVQPGQMIAKSGNTGKSTGPHLSYDVWRVGTNGQPEYIDPARYVSGNSTQQRTTTMPTNPVGGTTVRRTTTAYAENLDRLVAASEAEFQAADARYKKLLQEYESISDPNQKAAFSHIQLTEADRARTAALRSYTEAVRTAAANSKETETTRDPASIARLNHDLVRAALGDQTDIAKGMLSLLEYNEGRAKDWVANQIARGRLAREDAEAVFTAINTRQTQKIASFAQGLAAAKWISDERKAIVDRMLPPGTKYTFGPGNALFEQMQRMGMNPQPVEAVQVDKSYLEPEGILRQGMAMAPQVPSEQAMGITELRAQVAQNRAIPWPDKSAPVTAEQIGLPTGLPYNIQDILDVLNASEFWDAQDESGQPTPDQQQASAHLAGMGPQDWGAPATAPTPRTVPQFVMWNAEGVPVYRDAPETASPIEGMNEARIQGQATNTALPVVTSDGKRLPRTLNLSSIARAAELRRKHPGLAITPPVEEPR